MFRNLLSMNALFAGLSATVIAATLATPAHATNKPVKERRVIDFTSCAKPQYPAADVHAEHTGTVTLLFKLDQKGAVTESKVEKSSGFPSLDEEARSAIAKCQFSPAKAGVKYDTWTPVQYVWMLK